MYNGLDKSLLIGVPEDICAIFNRPMTHGARKLLSRMLTWAGPKFTRDYGDVRANLITAFASKYDPVIYEWVNQRFDVATYPGNGRSEALVKAIEIAKASGMDKAIYLLTLQNFTNNGWLDSSDIKKRPGHVGDLQSPHTVEIYSWLTSRFLATDFSDAELNKICEMGLMRLNLETLKSTASAILDQSKHSISYLYAILRDVAIRDTMARDANFAEQKKQKIMLEKVEQYAVVPTSKYTLSDSDSLDRIEEYASILESIKTK